MPLFKIGDKIRYVGDMDCKYDFRGSVGKVRKGDVVEISAVSYSSYSVKGSYMEHSANWSGMEENFVLDKVTNWRERIGGKKC